MYICVSIIKEYDIMLYYINIINATEPLFQIRCIYSNVAKPNLKSELL